MRLGKVGAAAGIHDDELGAGVSQQRTQRRRQHQRLRRWNWEPHIIKTFYFIFIFIKTIQQTNEMFQGDGVAHLGTALGGLKIQRPEVQTLTMSWNWGTHQSLPPPKKSQIPPTHQIFPGDSIAKALDLRSKDPRFEPYQWAGRWRLAPTHSVASSIKTSYLYAMHKSTVRSSLDAIA